VLHPAQVRQGLGASLAWWESIGRGFEPLRSLNRAEVGTRDPIGGEGFRQMGEAIERYR